MTGCHRGLKRKLLAGDRTASHWRAMCCHSYFCQLDVVDCNARHFLSSSAASRALSVLRVYSMFGHHPHPLGYLCAKFRFFCNPHCWANPWRKILYSITLTHSSHPVYLMCREPKLLLWNNSGTCMGNKTQVIFLRAWTRIITTKYI